jgi:hypothetical protein
MKAVLSLFASMVLFSGTMSAQDAGKREEVVFTRQMDRKSLEKLRSDVAEQGVHLTYDDLRFGAEDQLEGISFTVKDATGRSYKASTDQLERGVWFGFEFTHAGKQSTVLNVGTLVEEHAPGVKP